MVPMKATITMTANRSTLGKARPVAAINTAPPSRRLRKSWRGAKKPTASVNSAVPSSEALTTIPICPGLSPIADK
jgi:hypothetical protein